MKLVEVPIRKAKYNILIKNFLIIIILYKGRI